MFRWLILPRKLYAVFLCLRQNEEYPWRWRKVNTHFPWNHLCIPDFADPAVVILVNFKGCSCQGHTRNRKQGRMMLWENWAQGRWWILKTWFFNKWQKFFWFLLTKKKKLTKVHLPCLSGPSSQGKTAKVHEMCTNNIMKLTTWALCDLNISQENRSDELLGIHFTDHYYPTDSLWTAPPRRKKFPEWQFSLSFCRKKTPPVGMVHRMVCDA